jgi:hypothetical protein
MLTDGPDYDTRGEEAEDDYDPKNHSPRECQEQVCELHPWFLDCYTCGYPKGPVKRKVVKLGPIIDEKRDPTQTYILECGHATV